MEDWQQKHIEEAKRTFNKTITIFTEGNGWYNIVSHSNDLTNGLTKKARKKQIEEWTRNLGFYPDFQEKGKPAKLSEFEEKILSKFGMMGLDLDEETTVTPLDILVNVKELMRKEQCL